MMKRHVGAGMWLIVAAVGLAVGGCESVKREKTVVQVRYELAPTHTLPPGMTTLAVLPAETVSDVSDDAKWSELAANMVAGLLAESNTQFDVGLRFADRSNMKRLLDEKDLALSGISDGSMATAAATMLSANGLICTKITVRVEKHRGAKKTVRLSSFSGLIHGRPDVRIDEATKTSRNITVQCTFKVVDAATGRAWVTYVGDSIQHTEEGSPSRFYGSDKTEADMTPRDQIIGTLVEQEVRTFVGQLVPITVELDVPIRSGKDAASAKGVRLAAAEEYDAALASFETAMVDDPENDRAAFGAGLMCECLGWYDQAESYYKRAILIDPKEEYVEAKKRVAQSKQRAMGT